MRERAERLACGFWVLGQPVMLYPCARPAFVRMRHVAMPNLDLTPDEADALAVVLQLEAALTAYQRGDALLTELRDTLRAILDQAIKEIK